LVHVAGADFGERSAKGIPSGLSASWRTRNCETGIRSWRTTEPRPAICTVLGAGFIQI